MSKSNPDFFDMKDLQNGPIVFDVQSAPKPMGTFDELIIMKYLDGMKMDENERFRFMKLLDYARKGY